MSDPNKDAPELPKPEVPEPEIPALDTPALDAPTADTASPDVAAPPPGPIGDETARIPVEPEVAWNAPQPSRAMPWETPAAAAAVTLGASAPAPAAPSASVPPPGAASPPADPATPAGVGSAAPAGVLSAATVGWVLPPPPPVATGNPGWVIAPTGVRFGAWFIDMLIIGVIAFVAAFAFGIGAVALGNDIGSGLDPTLSIASVVLVSGLYFVYFVGLWTSQGKATLGMKLFKLQVANAADGKRLEIGPAVIRWFGLGYFLTLFGVVPALGNWTGLANFVWWVILLVTVASGPMHQGLHDRWAKSVVVRPEGAGSGAGWAVACLLMVGVIVLIILISIIAVLAAAPQIEEILRTVPAQE